MRLQGTDGRIRLGSLLSLGTGAVWLCISAALPSWRGHAALARPASRPVARSAQLPWPVVAFVDRDLRLGRDCIFLMNLDGGDRRLVTCDAQRPAAPAWSNRGDKLAYYDFTAGEGKAATLWTVDILSGKRQEIGGVGWLYGYHASAACPLLPRPIWAPYVEDQVLALRGRRQDEVWTLQTLRADVTGEVVSPMGSAANDADGWDWIWASRPVFNGAWGSFALQTSDGALFPLAQAGPQLVLAGTGELVAFRKDCRPQAALGWSYSNGFAAGEVPETAGALWPAFTLEGELVYELAGEIWRSALDGRDRARLGTGRQPHVYRYGIGDPPSPTPTDTDTPEPPDTDTPTATQTDTPTPTDTDTPTPTDTPTATSTPTPTATTDLPIPVPTGLCPSDWVVWTAVNQIWVTTVEGFELAEMSCRYPCGGNCPNGLVVKGFLAGPFGDSAAAWDTVCKGITEARGSSIASPCPVSIKFRGKWYDSTWWPNSRCPVTLPPEPRRQPGVCPTKTPTPTASNTPTRTPTPTARPEVKAIRSVWGGVFLSRSGLPLSRLGLPNRYDVEVDWHGLDPGKVSFALNGQVLREPATDGKVAASHSYEMASDLKVHPERNTLEVIAESKSGGLSVPKSATAVAAPIGWWKDAGLYREALLLWAQPKKPYDNAATYKGKVEFPEPPLKDWTFTIPSVFPQPLGGKGFGLKELAVSLETEAKTKGEGTADLLIRGGITAMEDKEAGTGAVGSLVGGGRGRVTLPPQGLTLGPSHVIVGGGIKAKFEQDLIKLGWGKKIIDFLGKFPWLGPSLKRFLEGRAKVGFDLEPQVKGSLGLAGDSKTGLSWLESTVELKAPVKGSFAAEIVKSKTFPVKLKVYAGGDANVTFGLPKPYLRKCLIKLLGGGEAVAWRLKLKLDEGAWQLASCAGKVQALALAPYPHQALGLWDPGWAPQMHADGRHPLPDASAPGSFGAGPVAVGDADLSRVDASVAAGPAELAVVATGISDASGPALAALDDGSLVTVYGAEDNSRPAGQGFEIMASRHDGLRWSLPVRLTRDDMSDFNPVIAPIAGPSGMAAGGAVAVWERFTLPPSRRDEISDAELAGVEIAYSRFDAQTGSWTAATLLTSNSSLDRGPVLAAAPDGRVMALWARNPQRRLGGDGSAPDQLMSSILAGGRWSEPRQVAAMADLLSYDLAFDGQRALLVTSQVGDAAGERLSYRIWAADAWNPAQSLGRGDGPRAALGSHGQLWLAWTTEGRLWLSDGRLDRPATSLAVGGMAPGPFALSTNAEGDAVLVWQTTSELGGDLSFAVWDGGPRRWSEARGLVRDRAIFGGLSPVFAADGSLWVAAARTALPLTDRMATLEDGTRVGFTGVPTLGRTDLLLAHYVLGSDLAVLPADLRVGSAQGPGGPRPVAATVRNLGDHLADDLDLRFYAGDPRQGAAPIAGPLRIAELAAGALTDRQVEWRYPEAVAGEQVCAWVDPESRLPDADRSNNIACRRTRFDSYLPFLLQSWDHRNVEPTVVRPTVASTPSVPPTAGPSPTVDAFGTAVAATLTALAPPRTSTPSMPTPSATATASSTARAPTVTIIGLSTTGLDGQAIRTAFAPGDGLLLWIQLQNRSAQTQSVNLDYTVVGRGGFAPPELQWQGQVAAAPGMGWYSRSFTVPGTAPKGQYAFLGTVGGDGGTLQSEIVLAGTRAAADDFGDPASGWSNQRGSRHWVLYEGGRYRIRLLEANLGAWSSPLNWPQGRDWVMEADVTVSPGAVTWAGLIDGLNRAEDHAAFLVDGGGQFKVSRFVAGAWRSVIPPTTHPMARPAGTVNHLMFLRRDSDVFFYCNGQILTSFQEAEASVGRTGLYVDATAAGGEGWFDNVNVYVVR